MIKILAEGLSSPVSIKKEVMYKDDTEAIYNRDVSGMLNLSPGSNGSSPLFIRLEIAIEVKFYDFPTYVDYVLNKTMINQEKISK